MFPGQAINDQLSGNSRARPVIAAFTVLIVAMLIALTTLYLLAKSQATEQVQAQAERLANSVETLLTPLMLAEDRVSLNFVVNQLVNDPALRGIRLTDQQQIALAVAGEPAELRLTREISPNGELLGELTLWIDPMPTLSLLQSQLTWVAIALVLSLIVAALTYRYTPSSSSIDEYEEETADFDTELEQAYETAADTQSDSASDEQDEDDSQIDDQTGDNPYSGAPEADKPALTSAAEAKLSDPAPVDDPDALISFDDLNLTATRATVASAEPFEPQFTAELADDADAPIDVSATLKSPPVDIPLVKSQIPNRAPDDDRVDLVDLLRPEHSPPSIPRFKPSAMQPLDDNNTEEPESEELEISIPVPVNTAPRSKKLPIITEEQLDLYTLEQELDLILAPENAGYLILIDTTSTHSANLNDEEQGQIRRTYRTLANSVARIYFGKVEFQGEDIQIRFDVPKSDDSHGVNALCSALLFNLLYRSYNQSRAKQGLALLNVHIAVVRGQVDRFNHLLDEARFLTRSTNSNQVISHTALSEAPELKGNILTSADIRREDEDKVLINSIEKRYQALLEKQARYLLAKLADRANQRSRAEGTQGENQ